MRLAKVVQSWHVSRRCQTFFSHAGMSASAEVIQPEDAGAGFRDVGALGAAKDALREAVQLPLQHPQLFGRGSLARPCKGVLLFGPPGGQPV